MRNRVSSVFNLYVKTTGEPEKEARQHVRIASEAGVMPPMTAAATPYNIAEVALVMLAGAKHVDAPKAAIRMFHAALCDMETGREELLKDIGPVDLVTMLSVLIQKIHETGEDLIAAIHAAVDGSIVTVMTISGRELHFVPHPDPEDDPPPPEGVYPVAMTRVLNGKVVTALASLAVDEPRLSPQEIAAGRARLKELFDQQYGDAPA